MDFVVDTATKKVIEEEAKTARKERYIKSRAQTNSWQAGIHGRYKRVQKIGSGSIKSAMIMEGRRIIEEDVEKLSVLNKLIMSEVGKAHRAAESLPPSQMMEDMKKMKDDAVALERARCARKIQKLKNQVDKNNSESIKKRRYEANENANKVSKELGRMLELKNRQPLTQVNQTDQCGKSFKTSMNVQQNLSKALYVPATNPEPPSAFNEKGKQAKKNRVTFKLSSHSPASKLREKADKMIRETQRSRNQNYFEVSPPRVKSCLKKPKPNRPIRKSSSPAKLARYFNTQYPSMSVQYNPPQGLVERENFSDRPDAWKNSEHFEKMSMEKLREKALEQEKMLQLASERGEVALHKERLERYKRKLVAELEDMIPDEIRGSPANIISLSGTRQHYIDRAPKQKMSIKQPFPAAADTLLGKVERDLYRDLDFYDSEIARINEEMDNLRKGLNEQKPHLGTESNIMSSEQKDLNSRLKEKKKKRTKREKDMVELDKLIDEEEMSESLLQMPKASKSSKKTKCFPGPTEINVDEQWLTRAPSISEEEESVVTLDWEENLEPSEIVKTESLENFNLKSVTNKSQIKSKRHHGSKEENVRKKSSQKSIKATTPTKKQPTSIEVNTSGSSHLFTPTVPSKGALIKTYSSTDYYSPPVCSKRSKEPFASTPSSQMSSSFSFCHVYRQDAPSNSLLKEKGRRALHRYMLQVLGHRHESIEKLPMSSSSASSSGLLIESSAFSTFAEASAEDYSQQNFSNNSSNRCNKCCREFSSLCIQSKSCIGIECTLCCSFCSKEGCMKTAGSFLSEGSPKSISVDSHSSKTASTINYFKITGAKNGLCISNISNMIDARSQTPSHCSSCPECCPEQLDELVYQKQNQDEKVSKQLQKKLKELTQIQKQTMTKETDLNSKYVDKDLIVHNASADIKRTIAKSEVKNLESIGNIKDLNTDEKDSSKSEDLCQKISSESTTSDQTEPPKAPLVSKGEPPVLQDSCMNLINKLVKDLNEVVLTSSASETDHSKDLNTFSAFENEIARSKDNVPKGVDDDPSYSQASGYGTTTTDQDGASKCSKAQFIPICRLKNLKEELLQDVAKLRELVEA